MDSFGQEPSKFSSLFVIRHFDSFFFAIDSDYDYPIATKKSIWNLNRSINDDKNQINFPLINNNGNEKNFESKKQQQNIFAEKKPILPAKNKSSNINHEQQQEKYAQSFYYDIPKNTPIKSSSSTRNLMTMSASTSSLSSVATTINNNNSLMNNNNRPQLPKKSSFVRKKIQKNYNDDNNYENLPESTINTLNRYIHHSNQSISSSMMMDQTKSLTLPRPMKNIPATTTSPSIANKKDYKPMNLVNNDKNSSTSKIINLSKVDSIDDDDDGCDYEYDYVCLESKKKLNNDDERIKILLPTANQYQIRYENLVIRSNDQQLPVLPVQNDNNFQSMKQFYR